MIAYPGMDSSPTVSESQLCYDTGRAGESEADSRRLYLAFNAIGYDLHSVYGWLLNLGESCFLLDG